MAAVGSRVANASDDAAVVGVVQDGLLHPLEGAIVVIHDSGGSTIAKVRTSADGRFSFADIPMGDYTIEATAPGLVGDHQHVHITGAAVAPLELTLVSNQEIVTIEEDWAVPAPSTATSSVRALSRQALTEAPGADARPVTDVIATQPGFVADGFGNVFARGNHGGVRYYIDGVPLPDSVAGLFAASLPTRLIDRLEIYTGGMPAEYGNRLGAVVDVSTRSAGDRPEGEAHVRYGSFGSVEPGAIYSSRLTDRLGALGGVSVSYSRRALDPPSIEPILHDTGVTTRAFARLDYAPGDANRYELLTTFAHSRFAIPLDPSAMPFDPNLPRPADRYGNEAPAFVPLDTDATKTEDELFAMLAYTHRFVRGTLLLAPLYKLSRNALFGDAARALGPTSDPDAVASDVKRLSHRVGGIARYSVTAGRHALTAGAQLDFEYSATSFATYARAPTGGVDPAGTVVGRDAIKALTTGAYVQDRLRIDAFTFDLGLRFDEFHVIANDGKTHDTAGVSPRIGASYAATTDLVAHVFTGINWQPPAPLDAANAARALGIEPGPYDVTPETGFYGEAGLTARFGKMLRAGGVAWGRYVLDQLDETAIGSTGIDSNYNLKRGRAAGVELSLDLRVGPWLSGFANASLGVAQGRDIASAKFLFDAEALAETGWQTLDHAQTLTANGGATIRDGRFELSGIAAYGSGLRTGPTNMAHVPGHVRADLAMRYTFVPSGYPIRVGIDVINVADVHYAFRIGNGFVGSSYGAPRSVFVSLSLPLAREPHHAGE